LGTLQEWGIRDTPKRPGKLEYRGRVSMEDPTDLERWDTEDFERKRK
jgi:hypothetical protein